MEPATLYTTIQRSSLLLLLLLGWCLVGWLFANASLIAMGRTFFSFSSRLDGSCQIAMIGKMNVPNRRSSNKEGGKIRQGRILGFVFSLVVVVVLASTPTRCQLDGFDQLQGHAIFGRRQNATILSSVFEFHRQMLIHKMTKQGSQGRLAVRRRR